MKIEYRCGGVYIALQWPKITKTSLFRSGPECEHTWNHHPSLRHDDSSVADALLQSGVTSTISCGSYGNHHPSLRRGDSESLARHDLMTCRHVREDLCAALIAAFPRLDIIVNNACQTIRRPPQFYAHLVEASDTCCFVCLPSV